MIKLLLISLTIILFAGCKNPTETVNEHTHMTIQKDDMIVVDYDGFKKELLNKSVTHNAELYDENATYVLFRLSMDIYTNINPDLKLTCGAIGVVKPYSSWGTADENTSLEYGALAEFTKKDLDDYNCLQEGGQLEDLTGSLYGYAEYARNRVTPVHHTVTSNDIIYSAQEINEAFAVFNK